MNPSLEIKELFVPDTRRKLARKGVKALVTCDSDCTVALEVRAPSKAARAMGLSDPLLATGSATAAAGEDFLVVAPTLSWVRKALRNHRGRGRLQVSFQATRP